VEKQQGGGILSCQTDCKVLRLGYKRGRPSIRKGVHFFGVLRDSVSKKTEKGKTEINFRTL